LKQLKVLSVKKIPKRYRKSNADFKINFLVLNNNKVITVYLPKRYFCPLLLDGRIIEEGYRIKQGELYSCSYSTFKDNYDKDVHCYSIEFEEKNFNLYYDKMFYELH